MLQGSRWSTSNTSRPRKATQPQLSDDELRRRIFGEIDRVTVRIFVEACFANICEANTSVLFPTSNVATDRNPFEIVYGTKPRADKESEEPPWQYAMIVRRNHNGSYTPLIKGQAWSTTVPWSNVLQGLLDTTATLIHKTIGQAPMPPLGILEDLPRYTPPQIEPSS